MHKSPVTLSVIVPVYNVQQYLRECLDSIINQTLKNIEIIIVNDCSPDNSEAIILEYLQKDPRIKYIKHQQNLGQGGARNTGIQQATGEWISFVDSDDYLELSIFEKVISKCHNEHTSLGLFAYQEFGKYSNNNLNQLHQLSQFSILNETNINLITPGVCGKIYKTADIQEYQLYFPEHLKCGEDLFFWWQYIPRIEPTFSIIYSKGYRYRRHNLSTMGNISQSAKDTSKICLLILEYLLEYDFWSKYSSAYLKIFHSDCLYYFSCLSESVKEEYLTNLIILCKKLLNLGITIQEYPFLLLGKMDIPNISTQIKIDILNIYIQTKKQNYHLYNDRWYKFGQLSCINKIKKIFSFFFKKLFNLVRK